MSNKPKIKYAKERNGNIFYPRTVADAIRFNDGESLEQKAQNGGLGGGDVKNFPVATELEAREATSNEVLMTPLRTLQLLEENGGGVGGGGGGITIPIISSEYDRTSVDTGTEISIPFTFYSPNLGKGVLHGLVDGVEVLNKQIPQGSSYADFGVLAKGSHRISIFVVDRGGVYTDTLSFNIRIGALDISSTFDDSTDFTITQVIKIPVTVDTISVDPVYLTYTIDSTSTRISAKTGYNIIQLPVLTPGAHKVTIKAESGVYVSNILSFNVVIEDATNLTLISDFDIKEITYRKLVEFIYRVSLKGASQFIAQYYDNGNLLKTLTIPAGTNIWSTRELEVGEHELKIVVSTEDGSMTAELVRNITVIESDYKPMESVSDASLIAYFDATGKTNNDFDKEVWTDKSPALEHPTVDLYNVNFSTNGWIDNALKLNGGAYAVINMQPLTEITNAGLTVDIRYKTRDVGFQNACVLDMRGSDSSHKGFAIDTEKIYLNSASNKLSSDVIQEEISRATFVIDPYNKITKIYNNGVLTETFLMSDNEDFYSDSKIYLGTRLEEFESQWIPRVFGDCDIYSFRVYARALESEEIVQNHISDIVDLVEQQEKYELNYMNNMPTMYFYGDTSAMTKDFKVPLRIKYISTNPDKYGDSFDLADCQVSWQGTSSLQYAVKNYKIRLKNQDGTKYKYSPYPDGIKEDTFCLKADYMESSHANNTGMAKFINDQLYDTPTPPQALDPNVRTTINGFPIQLYIALNDSVEPTYIGIFNFNHDKSCNKSLGLNNEVEGFEECVRFEVKANSDTSAGAFRDDSDESLRADFEINYPDEDDLTNEQKDAYYAKLKRVVTWVKNCTAETFKRDLESYFNKEYLIRYFVQAHLFGMVDNLGKNMMLATWDGNIWYPMFYDMDTQLGLDNTGYMEFASDIDMVEGVYNTSNSKLFTMLKECFADEIADAYCTLRRKGNYSMPTILSYWYGEQVSKIGELQYNKDMEAKYIAFKNDYLFMLHGRRYEHMKKWIAERMLYLDTIYGFEADTSASITIRANTLNTINLDILTYSPQYLKVKWRNGVEQILRIGRDASGKMIPTRFSGTVATATDQEIIIYNAQQIKEITGLASANPSVLNLVEASRLISLDCQKATVLTDVKLSSNNKFLSYLNLENCSKYGDEASGGSSSLDLSYLPFLNYVNLNGTKLINVNFPTKGCNLKELYVNISSLKALILENMPILETLQINNSVQLSTFKVFKCPKVIMEKNFGTANKIDCVVINAENINISDSPNLFNNNSSGVCFNTTKDSSPLLNCYIKDIMGVELLKIRGCDITYTTPTIKSLTIDADINNLMMFGIGFEQQVEELDINFNRIQRFLMKKYTNIKNLKLTSNLKGIHVSKGQGKSNNATYTWLYPKPSSTNLGTVSSFKDFVPYETVTLDDVLAEDILDLSNNPLMDILWIEELPTNISTLGINCDFTNPYPYNGSEGSQLNISDIFKLPTRCYIEGNLKSSNYANIWCTCTDTDYSPMENFEKLEWDLSEVTNLEKLFYFWKNLTILPDSLTPEVIKNSTLQGSMCAECTSLTNLNKLEGADLEISWRSYHQTPSQMFYKVPGPFTFGDITLTYKSDGQWNTTCPLFEKSGIESVGNITITAPDITVGNFVGISLNSFFRECSNLKSVGDIYAPDTNSANYFIEGCKKLENIGNFNFSHPKNNPISFISAFGNSSITDEMASKIHLPNNANLQNCFYKTKITDVSKIGNYYEVIRTSTKLGGMFSACEFLTSIPDLELNSTAGEMFSACTGLINVEGSIVVKGAVSCVSLFRSCSYLKVIKSLDLKDAVNLAYLFNGCTSLTTIGYLDMSYFTQDASGFNQPNNSQVGNTTGKITSVNFEGTLGKYFAGMNFSRNNPLDYPTLVDMINCLETVDSVTTLLLSETTFALLTEELITLASSKNWTLTK